MNFVAVCSQRRADRAHKLSFGHGEQQFISRSNPAQAPAPARRFAVHFIAIKRRPRSALCVTADGLQEVTRNMGITVTSLASIDPHRSAQERSRLSAVSGE